MIKYILSLVFLLSSFPQIWSQVENLSLSDAIKAGLANNFQIQISDAQIEIAKNNNNWKQAGKHPNINLTLNSGNNFSAINNPASFLDGLNLTTLGATPGIEMQWVLFDGYKVNINKQRLEQLEAQSAGNKELIVENTIQAIVLAYYRAAIEQEKIGVFEEVIKLSKERYEHEIIKRDLGLGSKFNILQMKDAYLSDSINVKLQQTSFDAAVRNLNLAMGLEDLEKRYLLTDQLTYTRNDYETDTLQQKMFADNQTLYNQFLNLQLLKTETKYQSSNRFPKITMSTGANYALSQNFLGDQSASGNTFQYYLNFSVSYNLYDAGRKERAIQNAMINEKIGQLSIDDQKRSLRGELRQNIAMYNDQADLIEINEARVQNAQENLQVATTRFESGVISSFDYRNVQLGYIRAALTKLEAIYNLKTTEIGITRITGGIISLK